MPLFRRRPEAAESPDPTATGTSDVEKAGTDAQTARTSGPYDEADAALADQSLARIDLGSLRVPGVPGVRIQVEADRGTERVVAVTGVVEGAAVQLQVFAAPRTEGVWDEVRAEMLREMSATDGARVGEADGPFGPELRGVLPGRSPEGKPIRQAVRFAGIDGPRWFLRAVFLGRAAQAPDPDDALHRLVRQTVVVRGPGAMAPRAPLPLRLPEQPEPADDAEAPEADPEDADDRGRGRPTLDPFQRGPEITETR